MASPAHVLAGIISMAAGGALIAVGLPIGIVGATQAPKEEEYSARLLVGPAAAGLQWSF